MADRKSPASPAVKVEPTFRQIIDRSSRFASGWPTPLGNGIDWPGEAPDDEATVRRKQVTAYKSILECGFQAAHCLLLSLLVRPVHVQLTYLPDDSPDRMETACGVFTPRSLVRAYRDDEEIDAKPADVAHDVANLLGVQRALKSLRELIGAPNTTSHSPRGESVPLPEWPCDQVITLGHWVESSWALAIQRMISRLTEVVLPRSDLMDAAPTVKWMDGAAKNVRNVVPPYDQWESRHLAPTEVAIRHLDLECKRWLVGRLDASVIEEPSLPMSRAEVARRFFGHADARFRKITASEELLRRVRPLSGKPRLVQFELRGLPAEIRSRFTAERWPSDSSERNGSKPKGR